LFNKAFVAIEVPKSARAIGELTKMRGSLDEVSTHSPIQVVTMIGMSEQDAHHGYLLMP